jgi:CRP-like cAMP-binding protein
MEPVRIDGGTANSFLEKIGKDASRALLTMASEQRLKKGDILYLTDDSNDVVYLLRRGRVKIYCLAAEGKELILWFCHPGELFGLARTVGEQRDTCARACEPIEVLTIPRERFREFLSSHPAAALFVVDMLSRRLRTLSDTVQSFAATCVTGRVVNLLQRLGDCHNLRGDDAMTREIPLTHQDIADMIGCCRQSVTEILGQLKRSGAITCERNRVRIIDATALQASLIPQLV